MRKVVWIAGLWLGACGLFAPREPQPPSGAEGWVFPDTPRKTLENLSAALGSYPSLENYLACLDPDFRFETLGDPPTGDPRLYENWTYAVEESVMTRLFQALDYGVPPSPVLLELTVLESDSASDSARFRTQYRFTGFLSGGEVLRAWGYAVLTLYRHPGTGLWAIRRWEDIKEDSTSFAEIKARFRNAT